MREEWIRILEFTLYGFVIALLWQGIKSLGEIHKLVQSIQNDLREIKLNKRG